LPSIYIVILSLFSFLVADVPLRNYSLPCYTESQKNGTFTFAHNLAKLQWIFYVFTCNISRYSAIACVHNLPHHTWCIYGMCCVVHSRHFMPLST